MNFSVQKNGTYELQPYEIYPSADSGCDLIDSGSVLAVGCALVVRTALMPCAVQLVVADHLVERWALPLQTRAATLRPCDSGSVLMLAAWEVAADWLQIGRQSVAGSW